MQNVGIDTSNESTALAHKVTKLFRRVAVRMLMPPAVTMVMRVSSFVPPMSSILVTVDLVRVCLYVLFKISRWAS